MHPRIERLRRSSAADARVIALGGGLPAASTFPRDRLARALRRALSGDGSGALQYGWPEGREGLREWIAARLRARGADVDASDVIVTSGAQQAIAIAADVLLRHGARVGVARETYPAALELFRTRGFRATVGDGDVSYAQPALANPRGDSLSPAARLALLARGRPIVEDDAYADLRFDAPAPPPLLATAREQVFYVGTCSKTLCPGLRVGWLVVPRRHHEAALCAKVAGDLQANSLAQALLEAFLEGEDFDRRLARLRAFYARRAEGLAAAIARHLPSWRFTPPEGGFSIWVETGEPGDDAELLATAVRHGVSFDPGREFRPSQESSPLAMRLCFSSTPATRFDEGVKRLARAWNEYRRTSRRARAQGA